MGSGAFERVSFQMREEIISSVSSLDPHSFLLVPTSFFKRPFLAEGVEWTDCTGSEPGGK